jgi:hypothetical protein
MGAGPQTILRGPGEQFSRHESIAPHPCLRRPSRGFPGSALEEPLCSFQYSASHGREISSGSIDEELNHADP